MSDRARITDGRPRALTTDELGLLAASVWGRYGARDRALLLLCAGIGLRLGHLLALSIGDVATDQAGPIVAQLVVGRGRRRRTVALPPVAREALAAWLADYRQLAGDRLDPAWPLFVSRKRLPGGGWRAVDRTQAWRLLHALYADNALTGTRGSRALRAAHRAGTPLPHADGER